jgi:MSHA biogenesis protein MshO
MSAPIHKLRVLGFTLIEMVVVIVVLAIVGLGVSNFIGLGARVYVDAVGRQQVLSQTRFAMERLTREIREALPNSVRVITNGDGTVQCVEFVPIQASSTYVNVPVSPEPATTTVHVVRHAVSDISTDKIAVYPLTSADVYGSNPFVVTSGNLFSYNVAPVAGTISQDLVLTNAVLFDADSPTQRYYLVKYAISYCANLTTGQLYRYGNYWPLTSAQQAPPTTVLQTELAGMTAVLMAENLKVNSAPFFYNSATLVANAVFKFTFEIVRNGEEIDFHREVHLVNVP